MARKAGDITMPTEQRWPPAGKYLATCIKAEPWESPKQKTPAVMLSWCTADAMYLWNDPIYVTGKAVARLNLVAQRVCEMDGDTVIPDDDYEAARFFANFIVANAEGKMSAVTIEEQVETFIHESGPNIGMKDTRRRHRVAFSGYDRPDAAVDTVPPPATPAATPDNSFPPQDDGPPIGDENAPPPTGEDIPF